MKSSIKALKPWRMKRSFVWHLKTTNQVFVNIMFVTNHSIVPVKINHLKSHLNSTGEKAPNKNMNEQVDSEGFNLWVYVSMGTCLPVSLSLCLSVYPRPVENVLILAITLWKGIQTISWCNSPQLEANEYMKNLLHSNFSSTLPCPLCIIISINCHHVSISLEVMLLNSNRMFTVKQIQISQISLLMNVDQQCWLVNKCWFDRYCIY